MKLDRVFGRQQVVAALFLALAASGATRALRAQTADSEPRRRVMPRILFGNKDGGYSDSKMVGFFRFNTYVTNYWAGLGNFPLYVGDIGDGVNESGSIFGSLPFRWGVPKSDWDSARANPRPMPEAPTETRWSSATLPMVSRSGSNTASTMAAPMP